MQGDLQIFGTVQVKELTLMEMYTKGTGIVCEYNPFHKGHAFQIAECKKNGSPFVVCVMSGSFVQRGEGAFQDKRVRAQNAVSSGADIVLELPFPYSSMSAEGFAKSALYILENSGLCSDFAFGSECAEVEKLQKTAAVLTKDFHKRVVAAQKNEPNLSYASCRQRLIEAELGREYSSLVKNPNDILAIEYIRANKTLNPIAIKRSTPREGFDESFASSSYIRSFLFDEERRAHALEKLPDLYDFSGIYDRDEGFKSFMLLSLMAKKPSELCGVLEVQKGSEYALIDCARKAKSFDELLSLLASKTHTDAKIRRMILFSVFGVDKKLAQTVPLYSEILAASDLGKKMLKKYKGDRNILLASRVQDIKKNPAAKEQYDFSRLCEEIYKKSRLS